jgi:hypothetical protein
MSSDSKIESVARSAARLRLAVFVTMGAMVLLYIAARLGLQFGHARVIYQEHAPGTPVAAIINDVCVALLIVALFRLTQMLKLISGGDYFGLEVIRRFRSFASWLLAMSLLEMLGPWIAQFFAAPVGGRRILQFSIESSDVLFLGVTILLLLLARLLERARAIDEEMREIV